MRRRRAELVRGDHEGLVLDRPGAQQHLPVVASGGQRERRGHGEQPRAADGEDPVELGEAQVVADAEPDLDPGRLGDDDLVAGLLARRLAVADPADVDVEHVDLAVGGDVSPSGPSRQEVLKSRSRRRDARRCCRRAGGRRARAPSRGRRSATARSSSSAPAASSSGPPSRFHFSGRTMSSAPSAAASATRRAATPRLRALSVFAVELDRGGAHRERLSCPFRAAGGAD